MRASYSAADMADMATEDGDRRVGVWGTGRESVGPQKDEKCTEIFGGPGRERRIEARTDAHLDAVM